MSEPTRSDPQDLELEQLLRATFAAEGSRRVPDSRPVPPFPATERLATVHPLRRKWAGFALVAAALVGIAVGATVIGHEAMDSHTPTPPATSMAPAPSTVAPTPSTTTSSTPPSTPTTTASTPPAAATQRVTVQGVVLTVPLAWHVVAEPDDGNNLGTCLTTGTRVEQRGYAADNCELTVDVGGSSYNDHDVDSPGFTPDGGICGTDGRVPDETVTTSADQVTVDGETAEHRVFTGYCIDFHIQQWTVPTAPFVQFTRRTGDDDPAGLARALAVVRSAQLPGPRSSLRLFDRGYLTGMSGATLSLDRVTVMAGGGVVDNNPTTYDYPVAADADVQFQGTVAEDHQQLTVDQLRTLANGGAVAGVPAVGALSAQLTTDGTRVTRVDLSPR